MNLEQRAESTKQGQLLPVHGFVLAGGKSSRMGTDKALLKFCGRPLVQIAVQKLHGFCADVSVVGNRDDLDSFAPVVHEARTDAGPAAGIEAGLLAAKQPWVLFVPVDTPLVPVALLQRWARTVLASHDLGLGASSLIAARTPQPAFCMVRQDCANKITTALNGGLRKISDVLGAIDANDGERWIRSDVAESLTSRRPAKLDVEFWFSNLNTPQEFDEAEVWSQTLAHQNIDADL